MNTTKVFFIVTLILIVGVTHNLKAQNCTLTVDIEGTANTKGTLLVGLYKNQKNYLSETYMGQEVTAQTDRIKVNFKDVEPGEYAIAVIHDTNQNGKFDKNFFGIPKEGYGFSNHTPNFGSADYEEARFEVKSTNTNKVSVKMGYVGPR